VVSLNLAILVISLTAPYSLITDIVSAVNPMTMSASDRILFFNSIKSTYLVLTVINALAIPPSILQVRRAHEEKPKPSEPLPVTVE
jgi:hypothetical protein